MAQKNDTLWNKITKKIILEDTGEEINPEEYTTRDENEVNADWTNIIQQIKEKERLFNGRLNGESLGGNTPGYAVWITNPAQDLNPYDGSMTIDEYLSKYGYLPRPNTSVFINFDTSGLTTGVRWVDIDLKNANIISQSFNEEIASIDRIWAPQYEGWNRSGINENACKVYSNVGFEIADIDIRTYQAICRESQSSGGILTDDDIQRIFNINKEGFEEWVKKLPKVGEDYKYVAHAFILFNPKGDVLPKYGDSGITKDINNTEIKTIKIIVDNGVIKDAETGAILTVHVDHSNGNHAFGDVRNLTVRTGKENTSNANTLYDYEINFTWDGPENGPETLYFKVIADMNTNTTIKAYNDPECTIMTNGAENGLTFQIRSTQLVNHTASIKGKTEFDIIKCNRRGRGLVYTRPVVYNANGKDDSNIAVFDSCAKAFPYLKAYGLTINSPSDLQNVIANAYKSGRANGVSFLNNETWRLFDKQTESQRVSINETTQERLKNWVKNTRQAEPVKEIYYSADDVIAAIKERVKPDSVFYIQTPNKANPFMGIDIYDGYNSAIKKRYENIEPLEGEYWRQARYISPAKEIFSLESITEEGKGRIRTFVPELLEKLTWYASEVSDKGNIWNNYFTQNLINKAWEQNKDYTVIISNKGRVARSQKIRTASMALNDYKTINATMFQGNSGNSQNKSLRIHQAVAATWKYNSLMNVIDQYLNQYNYAITNSNTQKNNYTKWAEMILKSSFYVHHINESKSDWNPNNLNYVLNPENTAFDKGLYGIGLFSNDINGEEKCIKAWLNIEKTQEDEAGTTNSLRGYGERGSKTVYTNDKDSFQIKLAAAANRVISDCGIFKLGENKLGNIEYTLRIVRFADNRYLVNNEDSEKINTAEKMAKYVIAYMYNIPTVTFIYTDTAGKKVKVNGQDLLNDEEPCLTNYFQAFFALKKQYPDAKMDISNNIKASKDTKCWYFVSMLGDKISEGYSNNEAQEKFGFGGAAYMKSDEIDTDVPTEALQSAPQSTLQEMKNLINRMR